MRRLWITLLLAVAAATLWTCAVHDFPVSENSDGSRDFSLKLQFSDELPVHAEIDGTKAADAPAPRYQIALYRYQSDKELEGGPAYTFSFTRSGAVALDTALYLPIAPDDYFVAGWVDWPEAAPSYDSSNLLNIKLSNDYSSGERARDAFAFSLGYNNSQCLAVGHGFSQTASVVRPVAQLRFAAADAQAFLSEVGVDADGMVATLRYATPVPDSYDMLTGKVDGARSDVVLTAKPQWDASGALVFLTDYVLVPKEGTTASVEFTVKDLSGKELYAFADEIPLRRGRSSVVSVAISHDVQYGTPFIKVSKASDLEERDEILLVYEKKSVALGPQVGDWRAPVPVNIEYGTIASGDASAQIIKILPGEHDCWYFAVEDGYLAAGTGNESQVRIVDEKCDAGLWYISISGSTASIQAYGAVYSALGYDPDLACFNCYDYRKPKQRVSVFARHGDLSDKILDHAEPGCYFSDALRNYTALKDQYVSAYDGDALTFAVMNPFYDEQLVISGLTKSLSEGDSLTVTVNWRKGDAQLHLGSYEMSVIKIADGTMWLANRRGQGFVVKM